MLSRVISFAREVCDIVIVGKGTVMKGINSFIEDTLKKASSVAMESSGKMQYVVKPEDRNQILTQADIEIGRMITAQILTTFPDHNIIDEELGCVDKGSAFTWVVDPIDGTSNFAAGLPHYGIMLGLLHHNIPIAGGVSLPALDAVYLAIKGGGAWRNGQRIKVTDETNLSMVLGAYGIDGHPDTPERTRQEMLQLQELILSMRNLRISNSAYDQMMVAQGTYGICANQTSKIWDNVAQQVIIEEAGGAYTDISGAPMDYSEALARSHENFTWLAGPPALHKQALEAISRDR